MAGIFCPKCFIATVWTPTLSDIIHFRGFSDRNRPSINNCRTTYCTSTYYNVGHTSITPLNILISGLQRTRTRHLLLACTTAPCIKERPVRLHSNRRGETLLVYQGLAQLKRMRVRMSSEWQPPTCLTMERLIHSPGMWKYVYDFGRYSLEITTQQDIKVPDVEKDETTRVPVLVQVVCEDIGRKKKCIY